MAVNPIACMNGPDAGPDVVDLRRRHVGGIRNVSSMCAPTRRPASDGLVDRSKRARTSSPSTVNSGVVVDSMTRYCGPRLRLRRR